MSTSASQPSSVTSTDSEYSPLLAAGSNQNTPTNVNNSNGNFYFLDSTAGSQVSSGAVDVEHERLPYGATEDEFTPRSLMGTSDQNISDQGILGKLFRKGGGGHGHPNAFHPNPITISSNLLKKRQAAIKIEPKVFFANERTFLAWLHSSVLLAGASVALSSGAKDDLMKQLYSIILLPVAIIFMVYSMRQYGKRSMMIRRRAPGPYEDIIGPSVLAVAVMISIVAQFTLKLYSILS